MIKKLKIMKSTKFIFTALFIFATLYINAQLKVVSNGSISSGYNGYANLNMGSGLSDSNGTIWGKWAFEVWGENFNLWKPWSNEYGTRNYFLFITPDYAVGVGKAPTITGPCLDVEGPVYSGGYLLTSDERLKRNIKSLNDKVNLIYSLEGKAYTKKNNTEELPLPDITDEKGNVIKKYEKNKNKKNQETSEFGFLAQELKEVYPELVSKDTLGYYYVNYIGLIPILVEALKDQKTQIDVLSTLVNKQNSAPQKVGATSTPIETNTLTYPVLEQNVPNPFNANTTIGFYLPNTVNTAGIYVYDMNGTQLKSYTITEKGKGNISIKGLEFSAGMYLYALIVDGKVIDTKRMILTK